MQMPVHTTIAWLEAYVACTCSFQKQASPINSCVNQVVARCYPILQDIHYWRSLDCWSEVIHDCPAHKLWPETGAGRRVSEIHRAIVG